VYIHTYTSMYSVHQRFDITESFTWNCKDTACKSFCGNTVMGNPVNLNVSVSFSCSLERILLFLIHNTKGLTSAYYYSLGIVISSITIITRDYNS